ncbi:MAG: 3-deoxy-D-manno-octulosonate 8-phosphate phosphatase, partial [Sulfuricurvum sp. 24-42-5]
MIRLLLLDVDGCMSDGRIIYNEKGEETKNFNVKDGFIIRSWLTMGQ